METEYNIKRLKEIEFYLTQKIKKEDINILLIIINKKVNIEMFYNKYIKGNKYYSKKYPLWVINELMKKININETLILYKEKLYWEYSNNIFRIINDINGRTY